MNGHIALINMRANRVKPRAVWLYDTDAQHARTEANDWWRQRNVADRAWHAAVRIDASDLPEALDLRFLRGLTVHVASDRSPARFHRLFDAAVASGAALVVGVVNGSTIHQRNEQPQP